MRYGADRNSTCRSCHAPVLWAHSPKSGGAIPLDKEPVPNGNIAVVRDPTGLRQPTAHHLKKGEVPPPGAALHLSHFVTCPDRKTWRKG